MMLAALTTLSDGLSSTTQLFKEGSFVGGVSIILWPGEEHDSAAKEHDYAGCIKRGNRTKAQCLHQGVGKQARQDSHQTIA